MVSRALKTFRSVLAGDFQRLWMIILKTPLAHAFAALNKRIHFNIYSRRAQFYKTLELSPLQQRLLQTLETEGYVRTDELFSPEDFKNLQNFLTERLKSVNLAHKTSARDDKDYWLRLSDTDFAQGAKSSHPLVEPSLKETLLKIVNGYLKQAGFIEYIILTFSPPTQYPLKKSQLWHHDYDNTNMVKFFIYLSDVNESASGPFTLYSRPNSQKIKNSLIPSQLSDENIGHQIPLENSIELKGPKFSTFLADTSKCYHMGSRVAEGHWRLMVSTLYTALPKATLWTKPKDFVTSDLPELSPLQEAAIKSTF